MLGQQFRDAPDTLPLLCALAADDEPAEIAAAAIDMLGETHDERARSTLREQAISARYAGVRAASLAALAKGVARDPKSLALVEERAANDPDAGVREKARALREALQASDQREREV